LDQGSFRLDISRFSKAIPDSVKDREVTLGVRPENIHLLDGPSKDSIEAKVMVTERLGSKIILDMSVTGKDMFKVVAPPDQLIKPGEIRWLQFELDKIHVIDKVTDEVLV